MKRSITAALLSAVVFPGAGQIYLKRGKRAMLFLLPAAAGVLYLGDHIMSRANAVADKMLGGEIGMDVAAIMTQVSAMPEGDGTVLNLVSLVLVVCWAGSVIDAYLLGAKTP